MAANTTAVTPGPATGLGVGSAGVSKVLWAAAAGAVLALVGYFLPWFTLKDVVYSGINFSENPPASPQRGAYLLLVSAAATLVCCYFWYRAGPTRRTAMAVLASGVLGLVVSLMYVLTALLQPTLSGWVTAMTTGTAKPNPTLFGLGELAGMGVGLYVVVLGFALVSWAGWSAARLAGALEVEDVEEDLVETGNPAVRRIVLAGLLGAIAAFLGLTRLGFIPFPTGVAATIMHVPAIVGGIAAGWPVGMAIGGIFGLSSYLVTTTPFLKDPIVSIGARLFIGVTAYFAYRLLRGSGPRVAYPVAAVVGTLTNTILVLGLGSTLHPDMLAPATAFTIAFTNGIPEAIIAAILILPIMDAIRGRSRPRKSTI